MWTKLIELVKKVLALDRRVDQHTTEIQQLRNDNKALVDFVGILAEQVHNLTVHVATLEARFNEYEKRAATERENFRLQLENLLLRYERRLPREEE
jgi:hypothetical protein